MAWSAPACYGERGLGFRADGGEHGRAACLGELDGVVADAAGAAGDQHGLAFGRARDLDRVPGGHRRNAEAGAGLVADVAEAAARPVRRQHHIFGAGAEGALPLRVPDPDPLAHARGRHAFADRLDLARAVTVRDHARQGDLAGAAFARLHVGRIDAGGLELDAALRRDRARAFRLRRRSARRGPRHFFHRTPHAFVHPRALGYCVV